MNSTLPRLAGFPRPSRRGPIEALELRDYAARMAQERRWHPTQELKILNRAGTRVEVCFHVSRLEEVVRWVLSWGSRAKVLGPTDLKKMMRDEVERMR